MAAGSDLLARSTAGASFLVIGQIATKLFTFLLNQLLIRYISPRVFGIASNFEVLVSTALFFSREGVRLSIQRTESALYDLEEEIKPTKTVKFEDIGVHESSRLGSLQSVINFGYISFFVGIPLSVLLIYLQSGTEIFKHSILHLAYFKYAIAFTWLLIMLELASEPLFVFNQYQLNFGKRTKIESFATFARCISTFGVVFISNNYFGDESSSDGIAVLAFTLGQLCYSLLVFALYNLDFYTRPTQDRTLSLKITKIVSESSSYYFNPKIFMIWKSIFIQMIFKQFLTEGDRFLINYVCTVEQQGVYAVVTNYGSLVARLLFQPIEESLRLFLTRLLSTSSTENLNKSKTIMKYLFIFYINLSCLILLAGFTNGSILLKTLLGARGSAKWVKTDLFTAFPQYILYIPFLAFNGILEAFFNSVATKEDISRHSIFMSILTIAFLSSMYVFIEVLQLGLLGLILANTCNMLIRIIYCLSYIKSYYKFNDCSIYIACLSKLIGPIGIALVVEVAQYYVLQHKLTTTSITELLKSAILCIVFLISALTLERNLVLSSIRSVLNKRKKND